MIGEILEVLEKCPLAQMSKETILFACFPRLSEGFEVVIEQIGENHYSVTYGGWHEGGDFSTRWRKRLGVFSSDFRITRLKVCSKDGKPFRWTLSIGPIPIGGNGSTKATWSRRILRQPVTAYLQNDLLPEFNVQPFVNKMVAGH